MFGKGRKKTLTKFFAGTKVLTVKALQEVSLKLFRPCLYSRRALTAVNLTFALS